MDAVIPSLGQSRPLADPRRLAIAIILALFGAAAIVVAHGRDATHGFDEVAQLSYVAEIQHDGGVGSGLEHLRMLDPSTMRFTSEANYLNHPPFYYWLMAQIGPRIEGNTEALTAYRLLNGLLAGIGLAAALAIGLAAGLQRPEFYAYCIPIALIPVLAPLAGSVNNDNAGFAGGAIATLAAYQLLATGRTRWLLLMLTGMIAAALAKLTALLLVGGFVGIVVIYLLWRRHLPWTWLILTTIAFAVAVAPYTYFIAHYGSPAPATPAQVAHMAGNAVTYGWQDKPRLSFPAYVLDFLALFIANWMPYGPRSLLALLMLAVPVAAVLCGLAGGAVAGRRVLMRHETPVDVVVVAGWIAIAATFACHVVFSYGRHLETGSLLDAYPRYYLPLAAIVPLAGLALLAAIPQRLRPLLLGFLTLGPIAFGLFGMSIG